MDGQAASPSEPHFLLVQTDALPSARISLDADQLTLYTFIYQIGYCGTFWISPSQDGLSLGLPYPIFSDLPVGRPRRLRVHSTPSQATTRLTLSTDFYPHLVSLSQRAQELVHLGVARARPL